MTDRVFTYHVRAYPQHTLPDTTAQERRHLQFFASQRFPLRMMSVSTRLTLADSIQVLDQQVRPLDHVARDRETLAAACDALSDHGSAVHPITHMHDLPPQRQRVLLQALDAQPHVRARLFSVPVDHEAWATALDRWGAAIWRRRWLKEQRRFLAFLSDRYLRTIRHSLTVWPTERLDPDSFAALATTTFQTPVVPAPLPPVLRGRYQVAYDHLIPLDAGQPYAAVLTSYDLRGRWDLTSLHAFLYADIDLALIVDSVPIGTMQAALKTDAAFRTHQAQVLDTGVKDVRSERALRDVEYAMHALEQQALHRISVTLIVMGSDRTSLEQHVNLLQESLGTRLRLMRPGGVQGELLKLCSTTPTATIDAPLRPRTAISHGLAVTVPYGFCRPDRMDGILWGIEYGTSAPIFFDPFADNHAAHMVVMGQTGVGKTYALMTWLLRMLTQGHQVILVEPMGHAERLVRATDLGGHTYRVRMGEPMNPLDLVTEAGGRMADQMSHVRHTLSMLLGHTEHNEHGEQRFRSRTFTNAERAALEAALLHIYHTLDLDTVRAADMPTLHTVCDQLVQRGRPVARDLADEIDGVLISSSLGETFNRPTALDWRFDHDLCYYDFSDIPQEFLAYFYGQKLGALHRYIHDRRRRRERKVIAAFDEFKYMARSRALLDFAERAARTWRTRGAALWTLDQTAHTYLGLPGFENPTGRSIIDNAPIKIIFRQDDSAAAQLGDAIRRLPPHYLARIPQLPQGECIVVWHNEVFHIAMEASDAEDRFFSNT